MWARGPWKGLLDGLLDLGEDLVDLTDSGDGADLAGLGVVVHQGLGLLVVGLQSVGDGLCLVVVPLVELGAALVALALAFRGVVDEVVDGLTLGVGAGAPLGEPLDERLVGKSKMIPGTFPRALILSFMRPMMTSLGTSAPESM